MSRAIRVWGGNEWEEYVLQLLRLHYPPGDLVEVPDRDRGDAGLEAYSSDGCAYQCYAPEEPLSVDDRYTKLRTKITDDVGKFENASRLAPLLGTTVIRRWILVTPTVDSHRVVAHCNKKAVQVKGLDLAYAAEDFEVRAITDETFARERETILRIGLSELQISVDAPDLEARLRFVAENGQEAANLDRKLNGFAALADVDKRERYAGELVEMYLIGIEARQRLRDDYPDLARPVDTAIANFRRSLVLKYGLSSDAPDRILTQIAQDLVETVRSCLPGVRQGDSDHIAYSAIAEWLMDCHLDFELSAP